MFGDGGEHGEDGGDIGRIVGDAVDDQIEGDAGGVQGGFKGGGVFAVGGEWGDAGDEGALAAGEGKDVPFCGEGFFGEGAGEEAGAADDEEIWHGGMGSGAWFLGFGRKTWA